MLSPFIDRNPKAACTMFGLKYLDNALPFGTMVYMYTFAYLFIPMYKNNIMNIPMIFAVLLFTAVDVVLQQKNGCTSKNGIICAIIIALFIGMIYSSIIYAILPEMLYHTDYISNKVACSMPSEQKFKCQVYKNGELITTMTK